MNNNKYSDYINKRASTTQNSKADFTGEKIIKYNKYKQDKDNYRGDRDRENGHQNYPKNNYNSKDKSYNKYDLEFSKDPTKRLKK